VTELCSETGGRRGSVLLGGPGAAPSVAPLSPAPAAVSARCLALWRNPVQIAGLGVGLCCGPKTLTDSRERELETAENVVRAGSRRRSPLPLVSDSPTPGKVPYRFGECPPSGRAALVISEPAAG